VHCSQGLLPKAAFGQPVQTLVLGRWPFCLRREVAAHFVLLSPKGFC